jgi:hypothetical protein
MEDEAGGAAGPAVGGPGAAVSQCVFVEAQAQRCWCVTCAVPGSALSRQSSLACLHFPGRLRRLPQLGRAEGSAPAPVLIGWRGRTAEADLKGKLKSHGFEMQSLRVKMSAHGALVPVDPARPRATVAQWNLNGGVCEEPERRARREVRLRAGNCAQEAVARQPPYPLLRTQSSSRALPKA